jgi:hypothetical protein
MLDAGGYEQDVARIEPVPFVIVDENATTANDDIELVLFMWRLLVRGNGDGEFDIECAALKNQDCALARGTRNAHLSLDEADHTAAISRVHRSLPALSNWLCQIVSLFNRVRGNQTQRAKRATNGRSE